MKTRLRIAILAHEFLINIGANDFLKNIIRGLAVRESTDLLFLCPPGTRHPSHHSLQAPEQAALRSGTVRRALRLVLGRAAEPVIPKSHRMSDAYDFYREACPRMVVIESTTDPATLRRLQQERKVDVFLPSIHVLPSDLPFITYWPDCQPKHFPEFFDDESQRVRDARINALLHSGQPMIINSHDAKQDMVRFYGARANQIFDLPFAPIIESEYLLSHPEYMAEYLLPKHYLIVCNQFWIHKSLETVIEAAAIAAKKDPNLFIVFTGRMEEPRRPEYVPMLKNLVETRGLTNTIRFLGYIPKPHQLELIRHSLAVVQPTLFEGGPGGGSVYDAVSLGVRAIVSDIPVNRELQGEPGQITYFPPRDASALAREMLRVGNTRWVMPTPEKLYQQSLACAKRLADRLYDAVGQVALASEQRNAG